MSLENDRPESFLGAMMAAEGVANGYTIVHGPTGCKYYPASVSESEYPDREGTAETRNIFRFASRYFFSQPRIPCTYLDMGRFITGGTDRLKDLYSKVEEMSPALITILNSPGSSLVGEDLGCVSGPIPTVRIDHADYSRTCAEGFQSTVLEMLKTVRPRHQEKRSGVNLVGICMLHLNWKDTVEDLSELLALCGIEVNCTIGAGWSVGDMEDSASAELNVLVYPEYGDMIAKFYESEYGIPFVNEGCPLGFSALERWATSVCTRLGKDPTPALLRIRECRKQAARSVALMESYHLLPKGHTFSLYCDGSLAFAAVDFLYGYLGMVPVAVTCPNGKDWESRTLEFIRNKDIPVSEDALHTEADLMITSGSLGTSCISRGLVRDYIEVENPGTKYVCVRPEPPIGLNGTLIMVDRVLNIIAARQRFL